MKLVQLEFEFRSYIDTSTYKDYTIRLSFDKLDSVTIDENLQVCTSETIRGKNKTFNAYELPTNISISGKFSDLKSTNIEIEEQVTEENSAVDNLLSINRLTGQDKSRTLNDLFTAMVDDTRLITIKMFYGDYKNYILNNFNLVYADNSTINVELSFQQILLRYLNEYTSPDSPYSLVEQLKEEDSVKLRYILSRLDEWNNIFVLQSAEKTISKEDIDTYSQGGSYGQ